MTEQPLEYYIDRYVRGIITREEIIVLRRLLNDPAQDQLLDSLMQQELDQWGKSDLQFPEVVKRVQLGIAQKIAMEEEVIMPVHRIPVLRTKWFRYAAAVIIVLGVGLTAYFLTSRQQPSGTSTAKNEVVKKDIPPGRYGAVLTLSDGSQMVLDSLGNGVIADQQGAAVVLNEGKLSYDQTGDTATEIVYNTMVTPKGRQFEMTLPDGTKVWLNAASSLKYPVRFTGQERKVFVTGEAYFDVAKNSKMPFLVDVNNKATVEVLGTQFNVNAYDDEPDIRTTLETGSVKVMMGGKAALLKPGQQARMAGDEKIMIVDDPDMEVTMSWRTNFLLFNFIKLDAVLRQIARWYDVEVIYENNTAPNIEFTGGIEKELSLSQTLRVLDRLDVKYKVEGKKLIILP